MSAGFEREASKWWSPHRSCAFKLADKFQSKLNCICQNIYFWFIFIDIEALLKIKLWLWPRLVLCRYALQYLLYKFEIPYLSRFLNLVFPDSCFFIFVFSSVNNLKKLLIKNAHDLTTSFSFLFVGLSKLYKLYNFTTKKC